MLLLPIFLCIVLLSPCSTIFDEKAEFVDAAVKAFTAAWKGSDNVLLALSLLGTQAASLMKVALPIGALVVETVNPKPQSEEYTALMYLTNQIPEIWQDIRRRTTRDIAVQIIMAQYFEKVDLPIDIMKQVTERLIDPTRYKPDTLINNYKEDCATGTKAPESILAYLHHRLVETCKDPVTPTEAQAIAEHRAYLMQVLLRLRVIQQPLPDPGVYLSEFMAIYEQLDKDVLNEDLDVFNHYFTTYQNAVQAFFKELRIRSSIEKVENDETLNYFCRVSCLLRALIKKSNFNYPYIAAFVRELKNQLIDVTFTAAICGNVIFNGSTAAVDKYAMQVAEDVALISSHTSRWHNDSLISAWPSAHNQILREQIMRNIPKPGYVDDRNLKIVADLTHPLLINTGLSKARRNFFKLCIRDAIVRAENVEYEHYVEGIGNYCSLNRGAYGFDTVIGRIPLNCTIRQETFQVEGRMIRLSNDADDLNIAIQYKMNELYDASTLPLIAATLKKKIAKEFITQYDFHCWGIVREWSQEFWSSSPTIDYWSSSYTSVDLNSITTLSYRNKGTIFQHCEEFCFFS